MVHCLMSPCLLQIVNLPVSLGARSGTGDFQLIVVGQLDKSSQYPICAKCPIVTRMMNWTSIHMGRNVA